LIGRGLSKATSESYKHDVICFITFCHSKSLFGESVCVDKLLLTHFIAWLSEKEIKRSTIQRRVMGVLAFWEFIFEEKQTGNPPMTLKRMHLKLHPSPNPTRPLNAREFAIFTEGLSNELAAIR
jgi:site-specific recombinase XerD